VCSSDLGFEAGGGICARADLPETELFAGFDDSFFNGLSLFAGTEKFPGGTGGHALAQESQSGRPVGAP